MSFYSRRTWEEKYKLQYVDELCNNRTKKELCNYVLYVSEKLRPQILERASYNIHMFISYTKCREGMASKKAGMASKKGGTTIKKGITYILPYYLIMYISKTPSQTRG